MPESETKLTWREKRLLRKPIPVSNMSGFFDFLEQDDFQEIYGVYRSSTDNGFWGAPLWHTGSFYVTLANGRTAKLEEVYFQDSAPRGYQFRSTQITLAERGRRYAEITAFTVLSALDSLQTGFPDKEVSLVTEEGKHILIGHPSIQGYLELYREKKIGIFARSGFNTIRERLTIRALNETAQNLSRINSS